jgi:hypothetical protein
MTAFGCCNDKKMALSCVKLRVTSTGSYWYYRMEQNVVVVCQSISVLLMVEGREKEKRILGIQVVFDDAWGLRLISFNPN